MKKILNILILITGLALGSCEDISTENVSKLTNYAVFEYEEVVIVPIGGNYTPTAIARENGEILPVTITGANEIDFNEVGVYNVDYSAVNKDGFSATANQIVIVHDPSIIGTDVSGKIRDKGRNERKAEITLVEGTTSIFYCTDFAYSGAFPMYFQMNGNVISEIKQKYPLDVTHVDLTYDPIKKEFGTKVYPDEFSYNFEYYQ